MKTSAVTPIQESLTAAIRAGKGELILHTGDLNLSIRAEILSKSSVKVYSPEYDVFTIIAFR